jgi:TusA-related sulfurtransferase
LGVAVIVHGRLLSVPYGTDGLARILDEAGPACRAPPRAQRRIGRPLESRSTQERLMQADKEIDTRGLSCPLPILKAKKALADLQSGQLLKVLATDPGSIRDFQAFSRQTGNELVEQQTLDGGEYVHLMRRR